MGLIGLVIRIISLIALYVISTPKTIKLTPPDIIQVEVPTKALQNYVQSNKIQNQN